MVSGRPSKSWATSSIRLPTTINASCAPNSPTIWSFRVTHQEQWITVQHYADEPWLAMIDFWRLYNLHLAHVIAHIPEDILTQPRHPHTLDKIAWQVIPADQPATLEYLVRDYLGHLHDHLLQLFAAARG